MGVGDRHLPRCSFLEDEIRLLRRRADEDSPVLGICLGAQLLAHAAGARVYPMSERRGGTPSYEVGWSPVRFHARDGNDAQIMMSTSEMHVLHWHGDTFDLPANAELLASSAICHNQAFRLKRRLFGLQFHCEVDKEHVEAFLREDADFVIRANGADGVAELRAHTARTIDESRTAGDALLKNIVRIMAGP
jgi:GMP synthase-like glutamine amidotransferase